MFSFLGPSLAALRPLRPLRLRRVLAARVAAMAGWAGCSDGAACSPCPDPHFFPLPGPVQAQLNRQITEELAASLQYTVLAAHLSGVAVSLAGAAAMFHVNAEEEMEHGALLGRWLVARGGHFVPADIPAPEVPEVPVSDASCASSTWDALRSAVCTAIRMERQVTESLLVVHQVARRCRDTPTADFITRTLLSEQTQALYFLGQLHTKLKRVKDSPSGLQLLDETLYCRFKNRR